MTNFKSINRIKSSSNEMKSDPIQSEKSLMFFIVRDQSIYLAFRPCLSSKHVNIQYKL